MYGETLSSEVLLPFKTHNHCLDCMHRSLLMAKYIMQKGNVIIITVMKQRRPMQTLTATEQKNDQRDKQWIRHEF